MCQDLAKFNSFLIQNTCGLDKYYIITKVLIYLKGDL
jgi:hypothetical protein